MNRFEKKCFLASAITHGLLLVVFLFGSAFFTSKKIITIGPVVDFVNAVPTDRPLNTGGNPSGNPEPPAPAPAPQPQPPQLQPEPVPQVVKPPEQKPEVKKADPKQEVVKDTGDLPLTTKQNKKDTAKDSAKPAISTTVVKRTNNAVKVQQELAQRTKQEADRKYREDLARYNAERKRLNEQVGGIVGGMGKSLNKSTVASVIGPGGQAYAEYGSLVADYYKRAVYATHPQSDDDADASIRIVVLRDGTVSSSQWVRHTGNSVLDKAVDRAMNSVRRLPQFPPEAKDSERSFNITIAFDAKRVSA